MTPKTVLVVEDDLSIHELLAKVLAPPAWRMDRAFDGRDGLARIEAAPYDLVLTDVRMPGMDGFELLRRIRQIRPSTKVIVMTGEGAPGDILDSLRQQAFACFAKPFSLRKVQEILARAVRDPARDDDIEVISARPGWIGLRVRCSLAAADRVVQFMRELKMDLPEKQREEIATAFKEILMNAVEHGCRLDSDERVRVACIRTSRVIICYIGDPGPGFSLDDLPHAAISNPETPASHVEYREEQGLRPGGFGIMLVRRLVDEMIYNDKGNEVILIKYL